MDNVIKRILANDNIYGIIRYIKQELIQTGPSSESSLEIASLLKLYKPEEFDKHEGEILNFMSIFFKDSQPHSLIEVIFRQYRKYISDEHQHNFTPVQALIVNKINDNQNFSFSAPTSTGKSYVFLQIIKDQKNDVVIIVPSRALINEYYTKLSSEISDRHINILTSIDLVNTKHTNRNIFIVTPERCRALFERKNDFNIDLFLFDEAQLGNEDSGRGMYFDSIVRRCKRHFTNSKFVFAHPFISNPEAQLQKNRFEETNSSSFHFTQRTVGQIYLCRDTDWQFHHFGLNKSVMGQQKQSCPFDPIERIITQNGSVLIYVTKSSIYSGKIFEEFNKYIDLCEALPLEKTERITEELKEYTGGDNRPNSARYSQMIDLISRGIVLHHGSLPLPVRMLIEDFTKKGLCRICFATSTLEQGVNMPFDLVYLDRVDASKPLAVKNLIGRAGRSSTEIKFDYGFVVIKTQAMTAFRKLMNTPEILSPVSSLEEDLDENDDDYAFKTAIIQDTFSDEYNIPESDLEQLQSIEAQDIVNSLIESLFQDGSLISEQTIDEDFRNELDLYKHFSQLYAFHLGRPLSRGELYVVETAIKIMLWRVTGRTFKSICSRRYRYASKASQRTNLNSDVLTANYITGYSPIPNKNLKPYPLFTRNTLAKDVNYDRILCDTYDYIDKIIGFKLCDIYCAALSEYHSSTQDTRALEVSNLIKYGTNNPNEIWMLRYGMTFEQIESYGSLIESIDEQEIVFSEGIRAVPEDILGKISRFIH